MSIEEGYGTSLQDESFIVMVLLLYLIPSSINSVHCPSSPALE